MYQFRNSQKTSFHGANDYIYAKKSCPVYNNIIHSFLFLITILSHVQAERVAFLLVFEGSGEGLGTGVKGRLQRRLSVLGIGC